MLEAFGMLRGAMVAVQLRKELASAGAEPPQAIT
jgi:hypothetical protein